MNHFESEPKNERHLETIEKNDKIILEIQAELLLRAGCKPDDNEKCADWINAYAEKFRKIAEADATLLELWKNDPEVVLQEIESRLYTGEGDESAA